MENTNIVKYILKGFSLAILDIVTFMLVFSVWALVNIPLFPWAFCSILFSLVLVNILVLVSSKSIDLFGVGVYASAAISTFLYYIFVMVFTAVTYIGISPKSYLITIFIVTLVYIAIVSGLYIAGLNKNQDVIKQEREQAKVLDVTLQLMNINENLKSCSDFVEQESYIAMIEVFNDMNERFKASTPFGRITKPIVQNIENQIITTLFSLNDDVTLLNKTNENQKACESIIRVLTDIKALIKNREKLIIQ